MTHAMALERMGQGRQRPLSSCDTVQEAMRGAIAGMRSRPANNVRYLVELQRDVLRAEAHGATSFGQAIQEFHPTSVDRFEELGGNCVAQAEYMVDGWLGKVGGEVLVMSGGDPEVPLEVSHAIPGVLHQHAKGRTALLIHEDVDHPKAIDLIEGSAFILRGQDGTPGKFHYRWNGDRIQGEIKEGAGWIRTAYHLSGPANLNELITRRATLLRPFSSILRIARTDPEGSPVAVLRVDPARNRISFMSLEEKTPWLPLNDRDAVATVLTAKRAAQLGLDHGQQLSELAFLGDNLWLLELQKRYVEANREWLQSNQLSTGSP